MEKKNKFKAKQERRSKELLLVNVRHVHPQRTLLSELFQATGTRELGANAARVHQVFFEIVLAHRTRVRTAALVRAGRRVAFTSFG